MKQRLPPPIILICIFFLCFAFALNVLTPSTPTGRVGQLDLGNVNPDEHQHLDYVLDIANGRWPVLTPTTREYESHQPPLYYALCSVFVHGLSPSTAMHVCRGVSTFLVLLTILVAYVYVRRLIPSHPKIAIATAAFVGLLPMNLSQAASVTNDTLLELIAALVLLVLGGIVTSTPAEPRRVPRSIMLGLLLGLGLWTKTSAVALLAAALALFVFLALRRRISIKQAVAEAALAAVITAVVAAPLYIRNTLVYGDPFAAKAFRAYFHANKVGLSSIPLAAKVTFMSFWGFFDSMQLHFPGVVYIVLLPITVAVGFGLWRAVRGRFSTPSAVVLLTLVAATVVLYIGFNLTYFQPQGRYLYTALIPIALGFVIGLRNLTPERLRSTAFTVGIGSLGIVDALTVIMIMRHYN